MIGRKAERLEINTSCSTWIYGAAPRRVLLHTTRRSTDNDEINMLKNKQIERVYNIATTSDPNKPLSIEEALKGNGKESWRKSAELEINNFIKKGSWEIFFREEAEFLPAETEFEKVLRPKSFDDFTGQKKVTDNLQIFVQAAKQRNEALDHVLLHGPPGLGKTTLSNIIANIACFRCTFFTISSTGIYKFCFKFFSLLTSLFYWETFHT